MEKVFIIILSGFALTIGLVILVIMSQNALMEQKRQISILRLIGFRIFDISNFWTIQSLSELIVSALFAIPVGCGVSALLFTLASSDSHIYPFVFSFKFAALSFVFVFVVILISHAVSMLHVRNWNLADNTRSRE